MDQFEQNLSFLPRDLFFHHLFFFFVAFAAGAALALVPGVGGEGHGLRLLDGVW